MKTGKMVIQHKSLTQTGGPRESPRPFEHERTWLEIKWILLRWIRIDLGGQLTVTLPVARSYTAASTFSAPALIASRMTGEEVRNNSA